jgi:hypothetical protein
MNFWYSYVVPNISLIEMGYGERVIKLLQSQQLNDYVGDNVFEDLCLDFMVKYTQKHEMEILPNIFGKWWGTDPKKREPVDLDLLMADPTFSHQAILGECMWRNDFDEIEALEKLIAKARFFPGYEKYTYVLFTKNPANEATRQFAQERGDIMLFSLDDFFDENNIKKTSYKAAKE